MAKIMSKNWILLILTLVIIAIIQLSEAKRTSGSKTNTVPNTQRPGTKTVTKTTKVITRPVNNGGSTRVIRPAPVRTVIRPVVPVTTVIRPVPVTTVIIPIQRPIIVPGFSQPFPVQMTRPVSCTTNPLAIVNSYKKSTQLKCRFNCATNQQEGNCKFLPNTCYAGAQKLNSQVLSYDQVTQNQYTYNCAAETGPVLTRFIPKTCLSNPRAIVNTYKISAQTKYTYNCASSQYAPLAVGYLPRECSQNKPFAYRTLRNVQGINQYMRWDCRTGMETIAPAGSAGLIIGIIVILCICLCIVGAVCGNKGSDDDHEQVYDEEVYIEEQPPMVVYEQPGNYGYQEQPGYYEQPAQVVYEQPAQVVYQQDGGIDPYTGQQVVDEVEY